MPTPTYVASAHLARGANPSWAAGVGAADLIIAGIGVLSATVNNPTITATYAGNAMTQFAERAYDDGTAYHLAGFWQAAPSTGTQTLGATSSDSGVESDGIVISFDGAHQTTPIRASQTGTGTSTAPGVTVSGADADDLGVFVAYWFDVATITAGAGETVQTQFTEDAWGVAILTKPRSGATTSFAPTLSASTTWAIVAVGVNGEADPPPAAPARILLSFRPPA
jgi:hypothetical protein